MKRIPWPVSMVPADYEIQDGVIYSRKYDDVYFQKSGGLAEKRYVFVEANYLSERFRHAHKITILEFGFGLGLNLLATLDAHASVGNGCVLDYVAFEKHPFDKDSLRQCLRAVIGDHAHADVIINNLPPLMSGFHRIRLYPKVMLTLIYGDALSTIKELDASVDVFYLDGFSPQKNDELWAARLFSSFRRLAAEGATFSTYSSATEVRRTMIHAGFDVQRKQGFGKKREMLFGTFSQGAKPIQKTFDPVTVIGGGIAGCSVALRASELGVETKVIESGQTIMGQGSSNPLPLVRPAVSLDFGPRGQFSWYAYFYAIQFYRSLSRLQGIGWCETGTLQVPQSDDEWEKMCDAIAALGLSQEVLKMVDGVEDFKGFLGRGIWMPGAGQLRDCQTGFATLLREQSVELVTSSLVSNLSNQDDHFELGVADRSIDVTGLLVLANAQSIQQLIPDVDFKLQTIRGQSTKISGLNLTFDSSVCGDGYVAGSGEGSVWSSGTFDVGSDSIECRDEENLQNMQRLDRVLGASHRGAQETVTEAWVGVRYATHDRMPHVGAVTPGLYALTGLGAKGFTWGPLAAEVLVSELLGLSCPVERSVKARMNPLRFR